MALAQRGGRRGPGPQGPVSTCLLPHVTPFLWYVRNLPCRLK